MDDLLHGQHDLESAKQIKSDLVTLLKSGGFNLRKWTSNVDELLDDNKPADCNDLAFDFRHQETTKTLGLRWNPCDDQFSFQLKVPTNSSSKPTKRSLLSDISKIFDPLGWLSPVTVSLKLLFQESWQLNLQWNDYLPGEIADRWKKIREDLESIKKIRIPRWMTSHKNDELELHGYSDSSTKAMACVIYCKISNIYQSQKNDSSVVIMVAKSRLVPSKKTISLPRLELCAAHLLSRLMKTVRECLSDYNIKTFGWSDSTAVLGWINGDPNRWKPFVANRVKQIIEIMPPECWNYVKSSENPADCASRGITSEQLLKHSIWWNGPKWLSGYDYKRVKETSAYVTEEDLKQPKHVGVITNDHGNDTLHSLINNHSNFERASRVLAWMLRIGSHDENKPSFLTIGELRKAKHILIKYVQQSVFFEDIQSIKKYNQVSNKSKLLNLRPFLDSEGLLKVAGRIRTAKIDEKMKHPLILPHNHHLTDLLIDRAHKMTFHGGARLTLAWLRQEFWIVSGNNAVKKRLRNCVICRKHDPVKQNQLMGDLPAARTNATRPFFQVGVDFTGFVDVKSSKGRGIKTTKGYVAVFVCMATKAVHLELVSDLTASAFLAALRRLAARRGTPRYIYSDNGTNFVKANRRLQEEFIDLKATLDDKFYTELTKMESEFIFNAPAWPSAGGLWEAAVKSLKHHLKRVIGEQKLTYEEFSTLLAQLEACLNSRPLCALSEDTDDIEYLTPSHFLSSGPILTIIETEKDERTRWHLTQKIYQDIWKRWRSEYLAQITARSKWQKPKRNIEVDDIVLIQDANLPPGKWALGRVIELHPGKDGYVRVVTLKTKNGTFKRPVVKLCVLPTNKQTEQYRNNTPLQQKDKQSILCNTTADDDVTPHTKRSTRKGSCYLITMALAMFMLMASPVQCAYNTSKLYNNHGMYFDKLSNMHLIRDQWKLIVYYDMNPYWQGTKLFGEYLNHMEEICLESDTKTHCNLILLQLHHAYQELDHYNKALLGQQFPTKRGRVTRGAINFVGNIGRSLFGILDDQFAEQYAKDINLIRSNQNHLALLWKNQTSIVESEYNLLKRMESAMDKQHKIFNQHLNNLQNSVQSLNEGIQNMRRTDEFTLSAITANSILMSLRNVQDTLLDTVTNIYYGKFNIHLIQPEQLIDELNVISGQLSKDICLPINNLQADLPKIYNLLKVKARMTKDFFIFEIRIPLVCRDTYEVYKMIAIPQKVNNNMATLAPIASHIAINLPKDAYVPMTEIDIQQCIQFDDDTQLCLLHQPIYHLKSDEDLCIKDEQLNKCKTNTVPCRNTWTQLTNVNNYLFFCCEYCTIRIICGHLVTTDRLSKVGIASLGEDCLIKGDDVTVVSHKHKSNNIHVQADIITFEIPSINKIINLSIPISDMESATSRNEKEIKELGKQIEKMKMETVITEQISSHDVHHYVMIYVTIFIVAAGGAGYIVHRVFKKGNPCVQRVSPAPAAAGAGDAPAPAPSTSVAYRVSEQCIRVKAEQNQSDQSVNRYARVNKSSARVNRSISPIFNRVNHFKQQN